MPTHVWLIFVTTLALIDTNYAQTYTSCDPTNGKRDSNLLDYSNLNTPSNLRTDTGSRQQLLLCRLH